MLFALEEAHAVSYDAVLNALYLNRLPCQNRSAEVDNYHVVLAVNGS